MEEETRRIQANQNKLAEFAGGVMEFIITRTGTSRLAKSESFGSHLISVGPRTNGQTLKFTGKSNFETFEKFFHWLRLVEVDDISPAEIALAATAALKLEEEQTREVIELLAEGGMTDFGKKVEEFRAEKGLIVQEALGLLYAKGQLSWRVDDILLNMQKLTGDEALTKVEILIGIRDFEAFRTQADAARNPV